MWKYCCIFCLHKVFPDFQTCAGDLCHIVRPHKLASLIFYQIHIVCYKLTKLTMVPIHIQKMVESFVGNYLFSHSNHPWDESKLQTESNYCFHKQDLPCIQHDHHWDLHLQVRHSLLLLHRKDSQEYNTFCHRNCGLYISDLLEAQLELPELLEELLSLWEESQEDHNSHPSHGNNAQTSCNCCCHRQGLPCIQHDHHWLLHQEVHHSLLLHIHKGFLVCNIFYHHNFCLCIFVLQGD